ncbi:hypothetical protein QE152_g35765 [Popillia japonica]|uniref:Uncharacterized protein n=1 Tax=Popillia japonica TaxID=7064 RepID=A0AAW1IFE2_POPJA
MEILDPELPDSPLIRTPSISPDPTPAAIQNRTTPPSAATNTSDVSFPDKIYYHPSTSKVHFPALTICRANFAKTTFGPIESKKKDSANVTSPEYIASKRKKTQEILEKKEKKEHNVATSKIQIDKLPSERKSKRLKHDSPPSISSDGHH